MSDRLDDVLRDLGRVDAPADFARRVRVQLDASNPALRAWPRLAAIAGTLLLVAGLWMAVSTDRQSGDRMAGALVGGAKAPPARSEAAPAQVRGPAQGTGPVAERHVPIHPDVREGGTSVRAGGALVPAPSGTLSVPDHQHALPALAQPRSIGPESLVNIPVTVQVREVAALTAIAPIDIPALGAGEGERR
jgi:hypothetical protein